MDMVSRLIGRVAGVGGLSKLEAECECEELMCGGTVLPCVANSVELMFVESLFFDEGSGIRPSSFGEPIPISSNPTPPPASGLFSGVVPKLDTEPTLELKVLELVKVSISKLVLDFSSTRYFRGLDGTDDVAVAEGMEPVLLVVAKPVRLLLEDWLESCEVVRTRGGGV